MKRLPHGLAPAIALALAIALPPAAGARDRGRGHAGPQELPSKPEPLPQRQAAPSSSRIAQESGVARGLWMDTGRVVEFPKDGPPAIRDPRAGELDGMRRGAGVKSSSAAGASGAPGTGGSAGAGNAAGPAVSPLFVDAAGHPRALPGGVILSLEERLSEEEARARLEADGLAVLRRINATTWLVDSPAGVASLDLADRLQASGRYRLVQPNWWKPRVTK